MSTEVQDQILIVEDEVLVAKDIRRCLRGLGDEVPGMAVSGDEAVELALQFRPDLILMDIQLKGEMDGITDASFAVCFLRSVATPANRGKSSFGTEVDSTDRSSAGGILSFN